MELESPAPVPGHEPAHEPHVDYNDGERRSFLGLPVKLALSSLVVVFACVFALAWFAAIRIDAHAYEQAKASAVKAADDIASVMGASEVQRGDAAGGELTERLKSFVATNDSIQSVAVASRTEDGSLKRVAVSSSSAPSATGADARRAINDGSSESRNAGPNVHAVVPVTGEGGGAAGVVAVSYRDADAAAAASQAKTRLMLGSLIAAALLSALLLTLLRRELFRPLDEMRRIMHQIRKGAVGVRIGWNRGDELGLVAREFDAMVGELEATQAELAKYVNRDPLTGALTADAFTDRLRSELTRARREGYSISLLSVDLDQLGELNRTHDTDAGDEVLRAVAHVISECIRPTDACGRTGDDSFHVALIGADAAQAAIVIDRVRARVARAVGIGPERTRVTCSYGVSEYPTHTSDQLELMGFATAAGNHSSREGRDRAFAFGEGGAYVDVTTLVAEPTAQRTGPNELASTLYALARALDGVNTSIGGDAHAHRVAQYAVALGRDLGMTQSELALLRSAAVLHDIGKVAVPAEVLAASEDSLDDRARAALQYHAWVARTMISSAGLSDVADVVFHASERWDGRGYPERLREEKIPLPSRILRAAEMLDELTSPRGTDAKPLSPAKASLELKRLAGAQLDPDLTVRLARLVSDSHLMAPHAGVEGQQDAA
jgi:diguanylate cyclase (GGDEF)-like protein